MLPVFVPVIECIYRLVLRYKILDNAWSYIMPQKCVNNKKAVGNQLDGRKLFVVIMEIHSIREEKVYAIS